MLRNLLLILCFGCTGISLLAKDHVKLTGMVQDTKGHPLPGATVEIIELKSMINTNSKGQFYFSIDSEKEYSIKISYVGYQTLYKQISSRNIANNRIIFELEEDVSLLSEVQIVGKTETQQARLQSIKAEVIDTKASKEQPSTLVELMNRSAGIRIKQMGGLGSKAGLMLNGFQGKAIKNFKDGVPMDYLGAGYSISLVPVNMLERVEVYKGVLPANLGADALGGAINLVTKRSLYRYAEVSYEVASFNTHRASINTIYSDSIRHFFIGFDGFYNHSDNNYNVDVKVVDQETATLYPAIVKLYHNKFTNYYGELFGGITHTFWADELRIGITGFYIDRQNQFGSSMAQPFGNVVSKQHAVIPTLRYQKKFNRLSVDQFLTQSDIQVQQYDTTAGTYDWYGNFIPSPSRKGETTVQGSLAKIKYKYFTSRTNLDYQLLENQHIQANFVSTKSDRIGSDPKALLTNSGRDLLSIPAHYYKLVTSIGLESKNLFGKPISNNLIAKFYHYQTNAIDASWGGDEIHTERSDNSVGLAEAVKVNLTDQTFLRFSIESARRLPEQSEMFGDGNFHLSNFELKPERSTNFNLGFRTEKFRKYTFELNSFFRQTRDLILLMPVNIFFTQNQNVDNVRGLGIEADATVSLTSWLRANGNFTYQSFRLFDTGNSGLEGSKLRNTPYFFSNLGLNASFKNVLSTKDKLHIFYFYQFVREYYLDYIPKASEPEGFLELWGKAKFDAPNIIPNQHNHSAGVTYIPAYDRISLSLQIKNILDASIYDNFRVQNAGRSIHFKINYIINK